MTGLEVARARGINPTCEVECAGTCTNHFKVGNGFPWPVRLTGEEYPHMAFFCSAECILRLIQPENCMGRA